MPDYIGQQFGNYRLLRLLGEGGFASVYLGKHVYLGTQAAVKILTTTLTKTEMEQFRDEARVMMRLDHPHVARVFDFGMHGSIPFLVMAYSSRGSLRSVHPRGSQVPIAQVVAYVGQIAAALQYIHDRHLIHCDIKPENLLVGLPDGTVQLSDFGIAQVAQSSRSQRTREMVGTMTYMAPEQIRGKSRRESDQYALGIVVYEWLTGTPPFRGNFAQVAYQHLSSFPQPLSAQVSVSGAVEAVIGKALAKDPKKRFSTVQAFALALEQASLGTMERPQTFPVAQAAIALPRTKVARQRSVSPLATTLVPRALDTDTLSVTTAALRPPIAVEAPPAGKRGTSRRPRASAHPVKGGMGIQRWLRALSLVLVVVVVIFLCGSMLTHAVSSLASTLSASERQLASGLQVPSYSPAALSTKTADHFFSAVTRQEYQQAYSDLGAALTLLLTPQDFMHQTNADDACYGTLTQYRQASSHEVGEAQVSLIYTVVRTKTAAYTMTLTFSQDGRSGNWLITQFGEHNDLGPAPPTTCS